MIAKSLRKRMLGSGLNSSEPRVNPIRGRWNASCEVRVMEVKRMTEQLSKCSVKQLQCAIFDEQVALRGEQKVARRETLEPRFQSFSASKTREETVRGNAATPR